MVAPSAFSHLKGMHSTPLLGSTLRTPKLWTLPFSSMSTPLKSHTPALSVRYGAMEHNVKKKTSWSGFSAVASFAAVAIAQRGFATLRRSDRKMHACRRITTAAQPEMAHVAELDVWSFNLRTEFQEDADGINGWSRRREGVASFIRTHQPALVCTQEATEPMLRFLAERLEQYAWVATSRTPGRMDETAGFLYDQRYLSLHSHRAAWLGPEGIKPGEPAWDAACPRIFEDAIFQIKDGACDVANMRIRVINTHFDHVGVEARHLSAELVAAEIRRGPAGGNLDHVQCAQIVCGDFNSAKGGGNAVYKVLTAKETGLRDSIREAPQAHIPNFTIHKFEGLDFESIVGDGSVDFRDAGEAADARHIDWVLWRDSAAADGIKGKGVVLQPVKCEVVTSSLDNGLYPSDHFPVSVRFRLSTSS